MTSQVKGLVPNPDNLSSVPRILTAEGGKLSPSVPNMHPPTHTHKTHKQINN